MRGVAGVADTPAAGGSGTEKRCVDPSDAVGATWGAVDMPTAAGSGTKERCVEPSNGVGATWGGQIRGVAGVADTPAAASLGAEESCVELSDDAGASWRGLARGDDCGITSLVGGGIAVGAPVFAKSRDGAFSEV